MMVVGSINLAAKLLLQWNELRERKEDGAGIVKAGDF
jgi:hypothetical protein